MNTNNKYTLIVLGVFLLAQINMLILGLSTGNVFSNGILKIKTVSALFLVQISFNINCNLLKLFNVYKKDKPLYTNDFMNINLINILILFILIMISSVEFSVNKTYNYNVLIYSIWTTSLLPITKNIINNYNLMLKNQNLNNLDNQNLNNLENNVENIV